MKNFKLIVLLLCIVTIYSCEKDEPEEEIPLVEELLDRTNYLGIEQPHDTDAAWVWTLQKVYDGIIGDQGFHTYPDWNDPDGALPEYENWSYNGIDINVHMFTIDIGEIRQLSRFKFWQRENYFYRHVNPKIFDLWGSEELNADGTFEGWTLLLENAEVIKPSGTLLFEENTEEDIEAAMLGHDFVIPIEAPKVRYIRFVNKYSWNYADAAINITELEFYGYKEQ